MKRRISLFRTLSITISSFVICFVIFLILEVFIADITKEILNTIYLEGAYTTPLLIIMSGFLLMIMVNIFTFMYLLKSSKEVEFYLLLSGVIISAIIITIISFIVVEQKYPYTFLEYSLLDKLSLIPQYIVFYAVYILDSPVRIWDVMLVIFTIVMFILIKLFVYEDKKGKVKLKKLYGSEI